MMTGRLFSWNNVTTNFPNRRGSASVWLIASVCFVIVFVGIVFFLLKEQRSERKTPLVPAATSKLEVREPIKPYTASNEAPPAAEKPGSKSDVPSDKGLPEEPDQLLEKPLNDDPARIEDVRPEDPAGKGILSQELNKQEPDVSEQPLKPSEGISPTPAVTPPLVAENVESVPKEPQPKEEIPKSVSPPEVSAPLEKTSTPPNEKTADVAPPSKEKKLKAKEKNLKELVVTVVQGNVRKGPSVKEKVIFRIARGDKLQVKGQKGNWYEIRLNDGRSGWAHRTLFNAPTTLPSKAKPEIPKNVKKGVIRGIRTVVTDPNRAQIIFELNGYFPPEIMVIEGEVPRVVCDFFSVGLARGVKKNVQVNNGVVKRIRVGVHKGAKPKTRVVLDLSSGQNYAVEQFFFEKEKYYALMVNRAAN
jgi:hypothetical protein